MHLSASSSCPYPRRQLTHCSAPLPSPPTVPFHILDEWMSFHAGVHGVDHFVVYDAGGVTTEVRAGRWLHSVHLLLVLLLAKQPLQLRHQGLHVDC